MKQKKKKKGGEDVKKAKTTGNGRIKIKKGERGKEGEGGLQINDKERKKGKVRRAGKCC